MNIYLSSLEQSILNEILHFNIQQYPYIKEHFLYLRVKYREFTGVGQYLNFEYLPYENLKMFPKENLVISSNKVLKIDNLEFGLNYELNITDGKFDFLELVTNGEDWDGTYKNFEFI